MVSRSVFAPVVSPAQARRLFSRIRVDPVTGCWCWIGATFSSGYGKVRLGDGHDYAHRLIFFLFNGPIPAGVCLRHGCDHRPRVCPVHLETGDEADNHRDRVERRGGALVRLPRLALPDDPALLPWVSRDNDRKTVRVVIHADGGVSVTGLPAGWVAQVEREGAAPPALRSVVGPW